MNIPDISLININMVLIVKIFLLILIGLYAVFVFIVFNNIRGLSKLVLIENAGGSPFVRALSFIYLGLTIFLFIAAFLIL